jgi:hypothetical protein
MNQIQISILYELIIFVYNVHLHEIVKFRKTAKKSANLPKLRGKLAADDFIAPKFLGRILKTSGEKSV